MNAMETKWDTKGELKIKIEWVYDDEPDTSDLGFYFSGRAPAREYMCDLVVDRGVGRSYGAGEAKEKSFRGVDTPEIDQFFDGNEDWRNWLSDEDPNRGGWVKVFYEERPILVEWLPTKDRRGYDYFGSDNIAAGTVEEAPSLFTYHKERGDFEKWDVNISHAKTPAQKHECVEALYLAQNYKRIEGLNTNDWWFLGCVVTVYSNNVEVGSDSLWGIESDSGDEYLREIEQDCISNALAQVESNSQKLIASAKAAIESVK